MKHAYLIIAHHQFEILEKLLLLLDHEQNSFYIHIDCKTKNFDFEHFNNLTKRSQVYFTKRLDVRWGAYSQIECVVELLKAASTGEHDYYHLLSGVDLPIKSNNEIIAFFDKNKGKEFVAFVSDEDAKKCENRINYYYFFQKSFRSKNLFVKIISKCSKLFVVLQKIFGFKRKINSLEIRKGSSWFSITDSLVKYVLENKDWIKKTFRYTYCADEMFLQTLVFNSDFYNKVYKSSGNSSISRHIDWNRGRPYTFQSCDFDELKESNDLFARKFEYTNSQKIVDEIFAYISSKNKNSI